MNVEALGDTAPKRQPIRQGWAPDVLPRPPSWTDEARCAQEKNKDIFYPDKGYSCASAKAVCAGCPVVSECLAYALEHREPHGVWGGLSAHERELLLAGAAA